MILVEVYRVTHVGQRSDALLGFDGAILGGLCGGILTLFGVLLTVQLTRSREDADKEIRRQNQARLLYGEISANYKVLKHFRDVHTHASVLKNLDTTVWEKLCVDVDWLIIELFQRIFEIYASIKLIQNSTTAITHIPQADSIEACIKLMENVLLELQDSFEIPN